MTKLSVSVESMPSGSRAPFVTTPQAAIDALESLLPSEIAMAVPQIRMWTVDFNTGLPTRRNDFDEPLRPISAIIVTPPAFGKAIASSDESAARFDERPDVSMDRFVVKTTNPMGVELFRSIEMSFVVHRPNVAFERRADGDSWSDLLVPGNSFVVEYGWRSDPASVSNKILSGEPIVDDSSGVKVTVPNRRRMRFRVNNYTLRIDPDSQVRITVQAMEDGELTSRKALLGVAESSGSRFAFSIDGDTYDDPYDDRSSVLSGLKARLDSARDTPGSFVVKGGTKFVRFGAIIDTLFVPAIVRSYSELGIKSVNVVRGNFSDGVGFARDNYGGDRYAGKNIGEFMFRYDDVAKLMSDLVNAGKQLTLYNFMLKFIGVINSVDSWDGSRDKAKDGKKQIAMTPHLMMKNVVDDSGKSVNFYIFDMNREMLKFERDTKSAFYRSIGTPTSENIRSHLRAINVPVISLMRANSYIRSSNFDVEQDPLQKTIRMVRALGKSAEDRSDVATKASALLKRKGISAKELMYSSAINGSVTMVGNFAFDALSTVWLDFGFTRWSGPFVILEKEDVIEPGSFTTTVRLRATGEDPLGTQELLTSG